MGCQASLDFAPPAGAHLSFYWTMDEAGDATRIDSTVGKAWVTTIGMLSQPGLFSNAIQIDSAVVFAPPFYNGLKNFDDVSFAFNATTSKGISFWFWFKPVVESPPGDSTLHFLVELHDAGYTTIDWVFQVDMNLNPGSYLGTLTHENFITANLVQPTFSVTPTAAWHMIACTVDPVAHTINVYVDGVLAVSQADAIPFVTAPTGDLILKSIFGGGSSHTFKALVDELGLSLKGALTQAQVTSLYNGGAGVTWPNITPIVPFP